MRRRPGSRQRRCEVGVSSRAPTLPPPPGVLSTRSIGRSWPTCGRSWTELKDDRAGGGRMRRGSRDRGAGGGARVGLHRCGRTSIDLGGRAPISLPVGAAVGRGGVGAAGAVDLARRRRRRRLHRRHRRRHRRGRDHRRRAPGTVLGPNRASTSDRSRRRSRSRSRRRARRVGRRARQEQGRRSSSEPKVM